MSGEQKVVQSEQKTKKEEEEVVGVLPNEFHKRIICHWGGEVDFEGMFSPYETAGYIQQFFNAENFEHLRKHINTLVFPVGQKTNPIKKILVLDNGDWQFKGFDSREETLGFIMVAFSPQTVNNMVHQAMNQVPVSLRKVKEIDMIFKAIYEILARLEGIEKKLNTDKEE